MSHWDASLSVPEAAGPTDRHSCFGPDEGFDIDECRTFCQKQGIPYHVVDVKDTYKREVLDYFRQEYRAGRTPNPCVRCNGTVKFGALLAGIKAAGIEYDYFCTGHYAAVGRPDFDLPNGKRPVCVAAAKDAAKDQSYFLYRVSPSVLGLEKIRFPLSGMTKREVRALALERGLEAAARRESQDFAPPEYLAALFANEESREGDFVDLDGRVLGHHRGIEQYTVGQRRGLAVSSGAPLYVHSIDPAQNQVVLASDRDLFCSGLIADDWVWAGGVPPQAAFRGQVKIRAGSSPAEAVVAPAEDAGTVNGQKWRISFAEPQRAVAPGQSAVVYIEGIVAGGGVICEGVQNETHLS
jgi:tRNA-specific 2-thiouridylase